MTSRERHDAWQPSIEHQAQTSESSTAEAGGRLLLCTVIPKRKIDYVYQINHDYNNYNCIGRLLLIIRFTTCTYTKESSLSEACLL